MPSPYHAVLTVKDECEAALAACGGLAILDGGARRDGNAWASRPELQESFMNRSTLGRPRALSDQQVAEILAWHRARKTIADVARENGVSTTTILNVIRRGGIYKQGSPELRAAACRDRHARIEAWDEPATL